MTAQDISRYIQGTFAGVETATSMGYEFFFHGADRVLPFVTIAMKDGDYDRASNLDARGAFRLNIGVGKDTYRALFGAHPAPPEDPAGTVATGHDFTALDTLLPHPTYAPQSWVCIVSPGAATFEARLKPLLAEAYDLAVRRSARRGGG